MKQININIPAGGGVLNKKRIIYTGVSLAAFFALWNWGSRAPYVGKYVNYGEAWILKGLGFNVSTPTL
jgi:hypothetical protein